MTINWWFCWFCCEESLRLKLSRLKVSKITYNQFANISLLKVILLDCTKQQVTCPSKVRHISKVLRRQTWVNVHVFNICYMGMYSLTTIRSWGLADMLYLHLLCLLLLASSFLYYHHRHCHHHCHHHQHLMLCEQMPKKSTSTTFPAKNNNISHHYLREAIQKKYGIFCGNFFPKRGGG